ncbi:hypothetical protein, partial [Bosea sp. Root381]|uniref:hypothetical protein n=1 Tax=Bosea sp. Root381 TaxID=1736524 RepID=UPI001AECC876
SAASLSSRIGQLNDLVAAFRTGQEQGAANSEPERLRRLAESAFAQTRTHVPREAEPRHQTAEPRHRTPAPMKKVANSRASDAGWEEF